MHSIYLTNCLKESLRKQYDELQHSHSLWQMTHNSLFHARKRTLICFEHRLQTRMFVK